MAKNFPNQERNGHLDPRSPKVSNLDKLTDNYTKTHHNQIFQKSKMEENFASSKRATYNLHGIP